VVVGDRRVDDRDVVAAAVVDATAVAGDLVGDVLPELARLQHVAGDRRVDDGATGVQPQAAALDRAIAGDQAVADGDRAAGDAEHPAAPVTVIADEGDALEAERAVVEDRATEGDVGLGLR
jgi:hypothetical protein